MLIEFPCNIIFYHPVNVPILEKIDVPDCHKITEFFNYDTDTEMVAKYVQETVYNKSCITCDNIRFTEKKIRFSNIGPRPKMHVRACRSISYVWYVEHPSIRRAYGTCMIQYI